MLPPRRESGIRAGPVLIAVALLTAFSPVSFADVRGVNATSTTVEIASIPIDDYTAWAPVYDPANGDLYVSGFTGILENGTVSIISGATNTVVAKITAGWEPELATVDPANGDLYVPNYTPSCSDSPESCWQAPPNVSVISGATNSAIASIRTSANPSAVAFDPANGELYAPSSGNVSVVSSATNTVLTTIRSGYDTAGATYDGANGDIYVLDRNSSSGGTAPDQLTIISGSTESAVGVVPVGEDAGPTLLNAADGDLYVSYSGGTVVVSSSTNTVVGNLSASTGKPTFVDPEGNVYFLQAGRPANVTVISGASLALIARYSIGDASYLAYDPSNGYLYSTYAGSAVVNITSSVSHELVQTLNLGVHSVGGAAPVYDPRNGEFYVMEWGESTAVVVIGNATAPTSAPPDYAFLLSMLGIGLGVGAVLAVSVLLLLRRRKKVRGAVGPPSKGKPAA